MRISAFALAIGLICMVVSTAQAERGTKAERRNRAVEGIDNALEQKRVLKENEAFANQHPEEAKRCFDPMMATADQHGVDRAKYFSENQTYFRECIEQQLGAQ